MATAHRSYAEKLKDPRWQKKRLEMLEAGLWVCDGCGSEDKTLNIHHCWYERGLNPWEYPNECYRVLCDDCHKLAESNRLRLLKLLAESSGSMLDVLIGVLEASIADYGPQSFPVAENLSNWDQVTGAELYRFYEFAADLAIKRIDEWKQYCEITPGGMPVREA